MDSIVLNSGVMLVQPPPEVTTDRKYKKGPPEVRLVQHLTGLLLLLIIINIGLVSWIIQSTQLLHDPLGRNALQNTIRVEGRLVTSKILQTDRIVAQNNNVREPSLGPFLTITAENDSALLSSSSKSSLPESSVYLSASGAEFRVGNVLEINSNTHRAGARSFKISKSKIHVEDSSLGSIQPESGGLRIGDSLETDQVFGSHHHNLRVESRTESMNILAEDNVRVEAAVGSVSVRAPEEIVINAESVLSLSSSDIRFPGIRQGRDSPSSTVNLTTEPLAYQLCLCASSHRVFLAAPDGDCRASYQACDL